jgi:hypothetical protein
VLSLLGLGDVTAGLLLLLSPLKRIIVLAAEIKMDTQTLVGGQSRIDRAFNGLLLVVENCQCRGTIYLFLSGFVLSSCLRSILPTMVAFILPGSIVSPKNAQNAESHFA